MIRTAGVESLPASGSTTSCRSRSPEVKNAFDLAGKIFFTPDYVLGGNTAIMATAQVDPMDPMFNDDMANPGCWMHKQSDWYGPDFFPDKKASGDRPEPSTSSVRTSASSTSRVIDEAIGNPVLFAGDAFMVTAGPPGGPRRRPVPRHAGRPSRPGSRPAAPSPPTTTTPVEWYAGNYKLEIAANLMANATFLGFDGGDLMPAAVGAGSFWTGIGRMDRR